MLKHWIAWIFKIPQTYWVAYQKDGKKILVVVSKQRGRDDVSFRCLVEHLVNKDYEVTDETLAHEEKLFKGLNL